MTMLRRYTGLVFVLGLTAGCVQNPEQVDTTPRPQAPVSGVVTYNGEPLAQAVVTLLPDTGASAVGETDANGKYSLECMGRPGVPPGVYRVTVSYFLSAEGEPQGLGPRSSIAQPPGMLTAKEMLPAEVADFARSTLSTKITSEGNNALNWDLTGPPLAKPSEKKSTPSESIPPSAEPKKAEAESTPSPAPSPSSDDAPPKAPSNPS